MLFCTPETDKKQKVKPVITVLVLILTISPQTIYGLIKQYFHLYL